MQQMITLLFCLLLVNAILAQSPSPEELLDNSIAYHDPARQWKKQKITLALTETRPSGSDRNSIVTWHPKKGVFTLDRTVDGVRTEQTFDGKECMFKLNGKTDLTEAELEEHRLNCERTQVMRDYYTYLWGLPMKLKDPGTNLESVEETTFQDQEVYALQVTYAPEVGSDTWYFYFDKSNNALVGYRFYHDESKNNGEYITLEGEAQVEKMRLPKTRKWYMNADDEYLGADTLREQ